MAETLVIDPVVHAKTVLLRSRIYVLRTLHVFQDGDAIILRGRVDSYYHKQLAQEQVRFQLDPTYVEGLIRSTFKFAQPGEYVIPLESRPSSDEHR